jgi:hypothetical protein
MAQGVAKHWSVDTLDTFKAVFINSPYISLLGKYLKTGVNVSNLSKCCLIEVA